MRGGVWVISLLWVLALGACSSALRWTPESHVVRSGETVYAIAFRYGIDHRDLARWNALGSGDLIYPGQRLRLGGSSPRVASPPGRPTSPPPVNNRTVSRPRVPPPSQWVWPTDGSVVAQFGAAPRTESGVHIGGQRGQMVRAAASGSVVYAGDALPGYGQLIIVQHNADYLSAYGFNDALLVAEGDRVARGERIARMGQGPGQRPLLHFEIRHAGRPVEPTRFLPAR